MEFRSFPFVLGLILVFLPIINVYLEWRLWIAFSIGVLLILYVLFYWISK